MKVQRISVILCVVNLLLLAFFVTENKSSAEAGVSPVLRARAIELVDDVGKVRAQLNIEVGGEVVFRLRDSTGTIRAKFGAGEKGSAFSLMDERTETTVQLRANETGGGLTLFSRNGKKNEIR